MSQLLAAILLAGGQGQRMQRAAPDKVLAPILGKKVFEYSLDAFLATRVFKTLCIVYRDGAQKKCLQALVEKRKCTEVDFVWVLGGARRQDSVLNALNSDQFIADYVFIHDCARPLIQAKTLHAMWDLLQKAAGVALAHPIVDSIKQQTSQDASQGGGLHDVDRSQLWGMETPQAFAYADILRAHTVVAQQGLSITDDVAAVEQLALPVRLHIHSDCNLKITHPDDLDLAAYFLQKRLRQQASMPRSDGGDNGRVTH